MASCLEIFKRLSRSSSNSERILGLDTLKLGLISNFLDVNWEFDLIELVDEVVNFLMSCGFLGFRYAGVDQVAIKTS